MLLLTTVIDTHFACLKDLSKAFACMTNDNLKHFGGQNLIFNHLEVMNNS